MPIFCGSMGVNTKFGFAPHVGDIDAAFTAPTDREELLVENLTYSDSVVGGRGITGWIDPVSIKLRNGQRLVSGGLVMEIGPHQLAPWLKAIVGNAAAPSNNTHTTKDKWEAYPIDIALERDQVAHGYRYCVVQRAVIRGRSDPESEQGQIVQLALSFLGVEESTITFPPLLNLSSVAKYPWLLGDTEFSYNSKTCPLISFDITIDNQLQPLFRNRLTPGCFRTTGRRITMDVAVPYDSVSYSDFMYDNTTDREAKLTFKSTNLPAAASAYSTVITMPNTRRLAHRHNTSSKSEVPLELKLGAFIRGSTAAMTILNKTSA